jgi:hypothetical protein
MESNKKTITIVPLHYKKPFNVTDIKFHYGDFATFLSETYRIQLISYFERKSTSCHQILPKFRTLKPTMKEVYSIKDARNKIEHYCAYQERCHTEVERKRTMKMDSEEIDEIIAHLINDNFLNEERFACFARGKHRIKQWGKIRITNRK